MHSYPKRIKKLLRAAMTEAYVRELHRELAKLDENFAKWRNGEIDNAELSDRIHQFETGPSRELFKRYNHNPHERTVAYAIASGILQRDQVPAELNEVLAGPRSFYQSLDERHELKRPEGR
jgi:hypothetical protein